MTSIAPSIRALPYPFGSALAVVSDVDGSSRSRYNAYVQMLVRKLSLDFGDSTWLRWSLERRTSGLAFFSRHFAFGKAEDPATFEDTRTLQESVAEFHLGNIDHFHAFLSRGPRVAILDKWGKSGNIIEAELGAFELEGAWSCKDFYIVGLSIVSEGHVDIVDIRIDQREGRVTTPFQQSAFVRSDDRYNHSFFVAADRAEEEIAKPRLDDVVRIRITLGNENQAQQIKRVLLLNCFGPFLLDRLRTLREQFGIETSLITEHAGFHFRTLGRARRMDAMLQEHVRDCGSSIEAFNGSLQDEGGDVIFSTDADDPNSISRVLPELAAEFEVRFLVPKAADSASGWTAETLLSPLNTRVGTIAYEAQRTMPNVGELVAGQKFDRIKSQQDTFVHRISRILHETERQPGLYWPLYTHLGGLKSFVAKSTERVPKKQRARDLVPCPYFEIAPMHRLQDRVFNVSGNIRAASRIWFARATTLYDYALIIRSISDHAHWVTPNSIEISSWQDTVLDKRLPRCPAQLYGITLYVEDPSRAVVSLDGHPINLIARNPPDDTGRGSITIVESEIQYLIFDHLDPSLNDPNTVSVVNGDWSFSLDKQHHSYCQLVATASGIAELSIKLKGLEPLGAQWLSLTLRRHEGATFGLLVETSVGEKFFFGDEALLGHFRSSITASHVFSYDLGFEDWRTLVAPFHGLCWNAQASPGGGMPSHALQSIRILCGGDEGACVDVGKVKFLRPRATKRGEQRKYCLGGSVGDFVSGQKICAQRNGLGDIMSTVVDQRGFFCFRSLEPGIYRTWTDDGAGEVYDRRGALVELESNVMYLHLQRPQS